jgi:hypothetical protein
VFRGAESVQLASDSHILPEHEPAWERFGKVVLEFTGRESGGGALFQSLIEKECRVLGKLAEALTRRVDKLDVNNRAEAIVLAREKRLRPDRVSE